MTEKGQERALLLQATRYFADNPGFHRLFEAFGAKYRTYAGFQGTAVIRDITSREAEALTGFLGAPVSGGATFRLTAAAFCKALAKTRFAGIDPIELLRAVSPLPLDTNRDVEASRKEAHAQWLTARTGSPEYREWLTQEWRRPHSMLRRIWTETQQEAANAEQAIAMLGSETDDVGRAWDELPLQKGTRERLPVFASRLFKNPHALDVGTFRGRLLLRALAYRSGLAVPETAEERAAVLAHFGILPDDVSSRVLISGLSATLRNGEIHPGWDGFRQVGSPFYATVADLCQIQEVSGPKQQVWVMENPAVLMVMLEKATQNGIPVGLVCTAGQPDLACWLVLDELVTGGFSLRYAGDFDPEGLLMAQRMLQRYGENCRLWHMSVEDYAASCPSMSLPVERLSKLAGIRHSALQATAEAIQSTGMAGYQEALIGIMEPWDE